MQRERGHIYSVLYTDPTTANSPISNKMVVVSNNKRPKAHDTSSNSTKNENVKKNKQTENRGLGSVESDHKLPPVPLHTGTLPNFPWMLASLIPSNWSADERRKKLAIYVLHKRNTKGGVEHRSCKRKTKDIWHDIATNKIKKGKKGHVFHNPPAQQTAIPKRPANGYNALKKKG